MIAGSAELCSRLSRARVLRRKFCWFGLAKVIRDPQLNTTAKGGAIMERGAAKNMRKAQKTIPFPSDTNPKGCSGIWTDAARRGYFSSSCATTARSAGMYVGWRFRTNSRRASTGACSRFETVMQHCGQIRHPVVHAIG
jgi:hypothetical protein